MHVAEAPPPAPDALPCEASRRSGRWGTRASSSARSRSRTRGTASQYGDAVAADQLQQARRLQTAFEMHLRGHQRRNPQSHELPEDMAERQRVQEAQRMHDALVGQIFLHLALDGLKACDHVAMSMDDAFGLGGGSRGEENLQRRIRPEAWLQQRSIKRRRGQSGGELFEANARHFRARGGRAANDLPPAGGAGFQR